MTTTSDPVFVDANILVHSRSTASPFHAAAEVKLQDLFHANTPVWASRQVFRPQNYRLHPVPIEDVIRDVFYFESVFTIADETVAVTTRWLDLLAQIPCGGKQVHDANIVATMLVHSVPNLLTHNTADFQRFNHLITVIPLIP